MWFNGFLVAIDGALAQAGSALLTRHRDAIVLGCFRAPLPRLISIIDWICPAMSLGARTGTSVSSISLRRLVCTPRPLTSRPDAVFAPAILSISSI